MKTVFVLALLSLLCGFVSQDATAAAQSSYDLRSPDGRIEVRIRTAGQVRYDVRLKGQGGAGELHAVSGCRAQEAWRAQPKVIGAKPSSHDQVVEPVVRQKFAKIRDHYNELRLNMEGGYSVVFRAYNEGAAYRFETALPAGEGKDLRGRGWHSISRRTSLFIIRRRTAFIRITSANICRSI